MEPGKQFLHKTQPGSKTKKIRSPFLKTRNIIIFSHEKTNIFLKKQ